MSVALCTYNGARFLDRQLCTIAEQTRPPTEVVISDDGSADGTLAIAEAWASNVPFPVKILRNATPLRPTANFEQAVAASSGELVALSDQDDVWAPERLERLTVHFINDPQLTLLGSEADAIDEDGAYLGFTLLSAIHVSESEWRQIDGGEAFEALLRRNLFTGATMLFRRDLLDVARPFPTDWLHDEWLAIIAAATGTVALIRDTCTGYRQHGSNHAGIRDPRPLTEKARRIRGLFSPRSHNNAWLLGRSESLVAHLTATADRVPAGRLSKAMEKLEHERFRSALPAMRLLRAAPILRELRTGRYDKYNYGRKDAVRDLLQSRR